MGIITLIHWQELPPTEVMNMASEALINCELQGPVGFSLNKTREFYETTLTGRDGNHWTLTWYWDPGQGITHPFLWRGAPAEKDPLVEVSA